MCSFKVFSWLFCVFLILYETQEARGFSLGSPKTTVTKTDHSKKKFSPSPNLVNPNFFKKCDPCKHGIACVPSIQCPAHVRMKSHEKPQICDLSHGGHGYCCTTGRNFTLRLRKNKSQSRSEATDIAGNIVKLMRTVIGQARDHFTNIAQQDPEVATINQRDQPQFMHNMIFRSSFESELKAMHSNERAIQQIFASRIFKARQNIGDEDFQLGDVDAPLDGTPLENTCDQFPFCPSEDSRFRNPDGKCNNANPNRGNWGAAGTPMERVLPPAYEDGIWRPRLTSVTGASLTNARTISRVLIQDTDRPHPTLNLLFMQFGQMLTHDVSQSASITTGDGEGIRCCSNDGRRVLPREMLHFACFPILIDPDDEFYSQFDQGCINFVRSSLAPDGQCDLSYGKQVNKVTHFIDASVFYGSDAKTTSEVRSFQGGRLRMLDDFGRQLLPLSTDKKDCVTLDKGPCFFAGDSRNSQIISLTALHILFAREHNRVADILSSLNPRWSDEMLFLEAKRVICAELQHIVYNEWLPHVIGTDAMQHFNLNTRDNGYANDYNADINPSVTSEFSVAAQRFGHSIVNGKIIVHHDNGDDEEIDIPDVMFNTGRLRQRSFYDELLLALAHQPMQMVDSAVTQGLSRFLFRGSNPFGLDLAAINIQRGRDHAIRPYNDYVELSGHRRIQSFDEFGDGVGDLLASVYEHPDDIDLWVGGLIEAARDDGLVGPTFGDIIADQFSKFRQGDRYFYEFGSDTNPGAFRPEQLTEIRKSSIARLICDNSDSVQTMSPKAFVRPEIHGNSPIPCGQIPSMNFLSWKET